MDPKCDWRVNFPSIKGHVLMDTSASKTDSCPPVTQFAIRSGGFRQRFIFVAVVAPKILAPPKISCFFIRREAS